MQLPKSRNLRRGMDYETFKEDDKSIRAVEMNFIIIGEAAQGIPEEIEEKYTTISMEYYARHAESHCACLL